MRKVKPQTQSGIRVVELMRNYLLCPLQYDTMLKAQIRRLAKRKLMPKAAKLDFWRTEQ